MASVSTTHFRDRAIDPQQVTLKPVSRKVSAAERRLIKLVKDISMEPTTLELSKSVFDLGQKADVTLYKQVSFTPATSAKEALERIGNDSAKFLEIVNSGLQDWTREQAKADETLPWRAKDEEENLIPYTGETITEEKSKQLAANVLNMAKMLFGYSKEMAREEKRESKEKAQAMLLGNPAVVEALKK